MSFSVSCTNCGKTLKAREDMVGKRARCPGCQQTLIVTAPEMPLTSHVSETPSNADDEFPDLSEYLGRKTERIAADSEDEEGLEEFPAYQARKPAARPDRGDDSVLSAIKPQGTEKRRTKVKTPPVTAAPPKSGPRFQMSGAFAVLVLFIPLAISILVPGASPEDELEKLLSEHPEIEARIEAATTKEEFLAALPEGRLPGAHLAVDSLMHWVYAGIAMFVYWGVLGVLWREKTAGPGKLLVTGLVTGTLGIIVLLAFQWMAFATQGFWVRGRGFLMLIFLVVKFIGYSYYCALDPESSWPASFVGFTCGVGLCEELVKALPLLFYFNCGEKTTWRGACLMGLATGIGFGVSEGIHYSAEQYNGIATALTYAVRFCSCVALHAIWSSGVALLMYGNQDWLDEFSWEGTFNFIFHYLLVAMLLHGLYDTLLKKDQELFALLVAFASFGWWLWVISGYANRPKRKTSAA